MCTENGHTSVYTKSIVNIQKCLKYRIFGNKKNKVHQINNLLIPKYCFKWGENNSGANYPENYSGRKGILNEIQNLNNDIVK